MDYNFTSLQRSAEKLISNKELNDDKLKKLLINVFVRNIKKLNIEELLYLIDNLVDHKSKDIIDYLLRENIKILANSAKTNATEIIRTLEGVQKLNSKLAQSIARIINLELTPTSSKVEPEREKSRIKKVYQRDPLYISTHAYRIAPDIESKVQQTYIVPDTLPAEINFSMINNKNGIAQTQKNINFFETLNITFNLSAILNTIITAAAEKVFGKALSNKEQTETFKSIDTPPRTQKVFSPIPISARKESSFLADETPPRENEEFVLIDTPEREKTFESTSTPERQESSSFVANETPPRKDYFEPINTPERLNASFVADETPPRHEDNFEPSTHSPIGEILSQPKEKHTINTITFSHNDKDGNKVNTIIDVTQTQQALFSNHSSKRKIDETVDDQNATPNKRPPVARKLFT